MSSELKTCERGGRRGHAVKRVEENPSSSPGEKNATREFDNGAALLGGVRGRLFGMVE